MLSFAALLLSVWIGLTSSAAWSRGAGDGLPRPEFAFIRGQNFYEFLGVDVWANESAIKSAFRARMMLVHPDHGGSVEQAQELNRAFLVLKLSREEYDAWLGLPIAVPDEFVPVGPPVPIKKSRVLAVELVPSNWPDRDRLVRHNLELYDMLTKNQTRTSNLGPETCNQILQYSRADQLDRARPRPGSIYDRRF